MLFFKSCPELPTHVIINAIGNNKAISVTNQCFKLEQCSITIVTTNQHHKIHIEKSGLGQLLFSSLSKLLIDHNQKNSSLIFSSILNKRIINTTEILTNVCYGDKKLVKRNLKDLNRPGKGDILFIHLFDIHSFFFFFYRFNSIHSNNI